MLAAPDVSTRRHDLDALRAGAMLTGVAFHAAHSFAPGMPWLIHDTQQSPWWFLFLFLVHGCRMPLFFLVSGYFTALLFERKGLSDLLRHRLARIGGPLVAAMAVFLVGLPWILHQFNPAIPFRLLRWDDRGLFSYLWFLWFLLWLVGAFAVTIILARLAKWSPDVRKVAGTAGLFVAIILSAVLLWSMPGGPHVFVGPGTSADLIPDFRILGFYAVFFAFGACCQRNQARLTRLTGGWKWQIPLAILILLPLCVALVTPAWKARATTLSPSTADAFAMLAESLYAWMMTLGLIGCAEAWLSRPSAWIRYLADASYWIYLAHLPLVMWSQYWVSQLPWPSPWKLLLITVADLALLLLTYHFLVRDTWVGRLLNGPKRAS
jgi:glucan biosynthesis protein C